MTRTRKGPGAAVFGKSYVIPNAVFEDISDSSTWLSVISHLSDLLNLPDLMTRHGLKKVHANFDEIYTKLNAAYTAAESNNNEKVMGGVVGIIAKMCADALLRDKLFGKGSCLLEKVMPLLEYESTLHLALNALSMVTHHGGLESRQAIARQNKTLVKTIRDHPDDPKVAELAIVTMDHATEAFVACEHKPRPADLKEIVIPSVLQTTVDVFRRPDISHELYTHGFGLLCAATQHCPNECRAVPGLTNLLAAFLRSNNINMRGTAMGGILRLTISECEFEAQHFDPARMMAAVSRGPPDHLLDVLYDYGINKSEAYVSTAVSVDYQKAMMQAAQDHDLYALGKKLAEIILRTEFSVSEGGFQTEDGRQMMGLPGLPFARWTDALPACATALRERGGAGNSDAADVVELKFLNMRQRLPEALALARAAQRRNPRLAYAYYIQSMGADAEVGLRAVKKGLRCPGLTPFLRCQMLWRATSHAGQQGLQILQQARDEDAQARAEGAAFLMSAWEDAKAYIAEAPPDTRHMLGMLGWYVLLTVVIRGPELSEDLRELDPARRKIKTATDFMKWMGYPIKKTQMNLTRELILQLYAPGAAEWGVLVNRFDEQDRFVEDETPVSQAEAEDELAAWLDNIDLDDNHDHPHDHAHNHHGHGSRQATVSSSAERGTRGYELYRCSWCGNPSAVLRKCGGCAKTRYCDSGCQKLHWAEHKVDCGGKKK